MLLIFFALITLLLVVKPIIGDVADRGNSILFVMFGISFLGEISTGLIARGKEGIESPNTLFRITGIWNLIGGGIAFLMLIIACASITRLFN